MNSLDASGSDLGRACRCSAALTPCDTVPAGADKPPPSLTKLLGLALASQAWVAWVLRNEPHLGVAKGLPPSRQCVG